MLRVHVMVWRAVSRLSMPCQNMWLSWLIRVKTDPCHAMSMLLANVECQCWMSYISMPSQDDLGQGPACSGSVVAHACWSLIQIILARHADIGHSTLTFNIGVQHCHSTFTRHDTDQSWHGSIMTCSDTARIVLTRHAKLWHGHATLEHDMT